MNRKITIWFYFLIPTLFFFIQTHIILPLIVKYLNFPEIYGWYIVGGISFLILFVYAILKSKPKYFENLSIKKVDKHQLKIAIKALVLIIFFSFVVIKSVELISILFGKSYVLDTNPIFFKENTDIRGNYILLLAWLPMFIFNIIGEEIYWRGYVFSKQIELYGDKAWIANGIGWLIFHIAFGWQLLLVLLPIVFILPYYFQKTKNTTVCFLIHGLFNGPTYILLVLGVI